MTDDPGLMMPLTSFLVGGILALSTLSIPILAVSIDHIEVYDYDPISNLQ